MTRHFTEPIVEEAALAWLDGSGYAIVYGKQGITASPSPPQDKQRKPLGCTLYHRIIAGETSAFPQPLSMLERTTLPSIKEEYCNAKARLAWSLICAESVYWCVGVIDNIHYSLLSGKSGSSSLLDTTMGLDPLG